MIGGSGGEVVARTDGVDVSAVVAEAVVGGWGLRGRRGRRLCECESARARVCVCVCVCVCEG